MAVNFRCEECGKLLGTEAEPGSTIKCTQCGKKVTVPAGLAAFPRPRISSDVEPAEPAHPQAPQQLEPQEGAVVLGVMAYIMPWVISVFFHLGLILIMFFVVMFFEASQIPQDKIVPDAELVDNFGGRMSDSSYSRKLQTRRQRLTKEYHSETSMLSMAKTEDETKI
ncbi:MAG: hypothetical protein KAU28_00170, partial [Phycisphaerae bacterium]|nr:hypothetical protein [Phycisphaerae bacterium]